MTTPDTDAPVTDIPPVDVRIIQQAAEFTPVFSSWQTYLLQGIATEATQQVPLIAMDPRRRRAWVQVNSVPSPTTFEFEGQAAAPGANANVLLIAVGSLPPPGQYTVSWKVGLDGTVSAADLNNFKLSFGGVLLNSINNPVVGEYPQAPVTIIIPPGNTNPVSIRSIGAATAGTIYSAQVTFTSIVQYNGYISVGTLGQVQNGQGGRLYAGQKWEIKAHRGLYFTGDGSTPLTVVVNEERDEES
jgi:hypothetical protein